MTNRCQQTPNVLGHRGLQSDVVEGRWSVSQELEIKNWLVNMSSVLRSLTRDFSHIEAIDLSLSIPRHVPFESGIRLYSIHEYMRTDGVCRPWRRSSTNLSYSSTTHKDFPRSMKRVAAENHGVLH